MALEFHLLGTSWKWQEDFLLKQFILNTGQLFKYVKGYLFSINGTQKGFLFCQNGIQEGKGLDLRAELPCIEVFRVPYPHLPQGFFIQKMHFFDWECVNSMLPNAHIYITVQFLFIWTVVST